MLESLAGSYGRLEGMWSLPVGRQVAERGALPWAPQLTGCRSRPPESVGLYHCLDLVPELWEGFLAPTGDTWPFTVQLQVHPTCLGA